ncbi:MAG: ABC transporter ATP-binding protein [Candidatus Dormiibacterota bacterium]
MWHGARRTDWGEKQQVKLSWAMMRRVFAHFLPYWPQALVVLICIGIGAALGLVPAQVTKLLVDDLTQGRIPFTTLLWLVAALIGASLVGGFVSVLQNYLQTRISQAIMYDLRTGLFEHLLRQSVAFFTRNRTGDVMSRLTNDVNGIQSVVSDTIFSLVQNVVILVSTIVFMVTLDWRLTIAAVIVVPLFAIPTRRVGQATFAARKDTQGKLSELTAYMQEVLGISGILLVKAFVRQTAENLRFGGLSGEVRDLNVRQSMIGRWFFMLMSVLGTAGPAVLWVFGGYLVLRHELSVGTVVTFATVLLARLYGPVGQLTSLHVNVVGSLALFQRIFDYQDLPVEIADRPDAHQMEHTEGAIAFDHVSFSYQPATRALDDVSFEIAPGELTALVGPSGAGKTTITSLLPRFYDPSSGAIRLDGTDLRDLTLESLGSQIGIVFQDTFLFHSSIRDNLLYVRPEASEPEMLAAARAAHIDELIQSLPAGYDTIVGERGHRLSGGEKQRIAIARVILKDPRILILDEATSALDSESERLIQSALQPLFSGRTSIVIAHRLSTVLAADRILVLDGGRLVEQGNHRELLQQGGLYARLYRTQFSVEPAIA